MVQGNKIFAVIHKYEVVHAIMIGAIDDLEWPLVLIWGSLIL